MIPVGDEPHPRPALPYVNLAIIAINVLVFVLLQLPNDAFTMAFSTIPKEITTGTDLIGPTPITLPNGTTETIVQADGPDPIWLTLLTSMFMHGGWLHLGGNMLFLFIFGDNIEAAYGSLKYLVFYLVCGIIASLAHIATDPSSVIPSLGASGAISGVLAAYLVLFPQNQVRVLVMFGYVGRIATVPALVMIGLWALLQFISGIGSIAVSEQTTGVAYWAHIGGFIAGLVITFLLRPFLDRGGGPRPSFASP
ncbi:MAG TPA: rhomboid family intramembrane serine protease [Candidatus Limnocylindria bacterium]|nr:rhomboid family intramembrane serine protease [Candidatus Limnocylindria bacterium]